MNTTPLSAGHEQAIHLLQSQCPPGSLVVDAGAWPGVMCRHLKRGGWNVIALDKEPCRKSSWQRSDLFPDSDWSASTDSESTFKNEMNSLGIEVMNVDLETTRIPIETGTVDAVVLTEVIEHLWNDPLFALTEINRILKEGSGLLLLSTPNFLSLRNRMNFLRGNIDQVIESPFVSFLKKQKLGHFGHVRLYSPAELQTMLELLGFETTFFFRSLHYHKKVDSHSSGVHEAPRRKSQAAPRAQRSLLSKFIRSPRGYRDAAIATFQAWLESRRPSFRSHMFVVARRIGNASFEQNCPARVKAVVMHNRL